MDKVLMELINLNKEAKDEEYQALLEDFLSDNSINIVEEPVICAYCSNHVPYSSGCREYILIEHENIEDAFCSEDCASNYIKNGCKRK